jgi:hypothetical protein
MGQIIAKLARIGDADARKREPLLTLEIGDFLGRPQSQGVAAGRQCCRGKAGRE